MSTRSVERGSGVSIAGRVELGHGAFGEVAAGTKCPRQNGVDGKAGVDTLDKADLSKHLRSVMTRKLSLDATARELLDAAGRSTAQRASHTVVGGHEYTMRQTVIALLAGASLTEHENPGEATIYVISGRIEVRAGDESWQARSGDLVEIPPRRHSLHALENSAVLLTAIPRERPTG